MCSQDTKAQTLHELIKDLTACLIESLRYGLPSLNLGFWKKRKHHRVFRGRRV
jgi:hypothetical protein